jgi:hypothetical protein
MATATLATAAHASVDWLVSSEGKREIHLLRSMMAPPAYAG